MTPADLLLEKSRERTAKFHKYEAISLLAGQVAESAKKMEDGTYQVDAKLLEALKAKNAG